MSVPPPPPPPPPPMDGGFGGPPPPPPIPGAPPVPGAPPIPGVPGAPPFPGAPAFPGFGPALPKKKNEKPKIPMKNLNWSKINPNQVKGTIWENIDDGKIKFNIDDFADTFGQKVVEKKKEAAPVQKKVEKPCFSDPAKKRNIDIVLNKIKKKPIDISDAIITYAEDVLTPEVCEVLIPIFPTDKDYDTVSKATEKFESEDDFDNCDLFVVLIGCVIGYKERLDAILFKSNYSKRSVETLQLIDYFFKGFDFVKTNEHFHKLLEIFLAVGNYINGTGAKGGAFGFRLASLSKFSDMKSKDNKINLLQYIVNFIMDDLKKPEILDIIPFLQLFEKMQMIAINESFNALKKNFASVESLKSKIEAKKDELEEDDKTQEFLASFYDHAKKTIDFIEEKIKNIDEKFQELVKFFGEDPKKMTLDVFINIFKTFYMNLFQALKNYKELKTKEEKLKELQAKKKK